MNNLEFIPGTDYTDYVIERLGVERQEEPLYRENGKWYRPKRFQVDYETQSDNIGEVFVEYVSKNFSSDVRLVEARGLEAAGTVQAVEPNPEYESTFEEVGAFPDLRETLISDSETFPETEAYGYLNLNETLENLSEQLSEEGGFGSAFLIDGADEKSKEVADRVYSKDAKIEREEIPKFDLELQSRVFVRHQDIIYEIYDE